MTATATINQTDSKHEQVTPKQAIKSRTITSHHLPQTKQITPSLSANPNSHPALSAPVVMYPFAYYMPCLLDGINRISTLRQNTATSRAVRVYIHKQPWGHFSHLPPACCCI